MASVQGFVPCSVCGRDTGLVPTEAGSYPYCRAHRKEMDEKVMLRTMGDGTSQLAIPELKVQAMPGDTRFTKEASSVPKTPPVPSGDEEEKGATIYFVDSIIRIGDPKKPYRYDLIHRHEGEEQWATPAAARRYARKLVAVDMKRAAIHRPCTDKSYYRVEYYKYTLRNGAPTGLSNYATERITLSYKRNESDSEDE